MKKTICFVFVLILALSACGTKPARKVVIGLDDDFPPMGFRDSNGDLTGFDIELAKEACTRMGVEVEFQPIDWDSKELEMSSKKIDLLWNGVTITPARQEIWAFSEPYIANSQIIIVKNGSPIGSKADLAGKKIGVQKGSSAVDAVEADSAVYATFDEVLEYPENVSAFLDLDIGRIDAVVADEIMARYYITQQKSDFKVLDEDFGDEDYGIATRKDETVLIAAVQKALDDMKKDGKYDEIYKKWFGGGN